MSDELWISPAEAIARLSPRYGDAAKSVIVNRCQRGLLDGRGEIVVRAYQNCHELAWNNYLGKQVEVPLEDTRDNKQILPPDFWSLGFVDAPPPFGGEGINEFNRTVWADWEIGDFSYRSIWASSEANGIERCDVAGMRFNSEQLALLASPSVEKHTVTRTRANLYDWEAVLIDLGGVLSQGLLIPDGFAHGAQARIEKWMQDWFAENCSAYPNESTIRPKAKRVLDAIQREQAKCDKAG